MKVSVAAVLILFTCSCVLFSADLKTYQSTYAKETASIVVEHGLTISELDESYSESLDNLSKRATSAGDLDRARETIAEIARFAKEKSMISENAISSSPDLRRAQLIYIQSVQALQLARAKKVMVLAAKYDSALAKLQMSLTKQENLNGASAVQNERATVAKSEDIADARKTLSAAKSNRAVAKQKNQDIIAVTSEPSRSYAEFDDDGCIIVGTPSDIMNGGRATYQSWVYPAMKSQSGALIWDGNDRGGLDRVLRFTEGRLSVTLNAVPHVSMMSKNELPEQEWSHISVVLGRTSLAIYINGKLDSEKRTKMPSHDDASYISFGRGVYKGAFYDTQFHGKMSDVRLWRRPLTDDEVRNIYKGSRVKSTGLIGVWDFRDGKLTSTSGKKYGTMTLGAVRMGKE